MHRDPVVEELRQTAAEIMESCGNDVHRVAERLRAEQSRQPQRVIRRRPTPQPPGTEPPVRDEGA